VSAMQENREVRLTSAQAVRLVAGRELTTRLRSRAYRITTAVLVVLVVGFAVVMSLLSSLGGGKEHVGLVGDTASMTARVESAATSLGEEVRTVRVPDVQAGRRMVADGRLDVLVVGSQGPRLQVVVEEKLDDRLRAALTSAAGQLVLDRQIRDLGGDPADVASQVARAGVGVTALKPPVTYDPQRLAVGSVAGILVYLALITTGQSVAMGVVEEKSSRVVELLLATIRPWQLMAGKVVGIGLVGLLQVLVVGAAGVIAGEVSGSLDLSISTSVGVVAWLVVWFVLGFTLYSLVFAGLGALVSRQEDVGGVIAPVTMLLVLGYVVGISVLPSDPGNPVVAIASLLPVFSPTMMPMRLAMGGVPLWQTMLSLALALGTVPLLLMLAGRLYRNGVVRTGARVKIRDALRAG
jgi:ABC-2 type transport system permease protein